MRHRRPGGVPGKPGEGGAVCPCPASSSHSSLAASMEEEEVVEAELLGLPQRQGGLGAEEEASGVGGWGGGGGEGKTVVPHSSPMMAAGWTWPLWSPWGCYSAPRSLCWLQTGPPPVRRGPTRSSSTSPGRGHSHRDCFFNRFSLKKWFWYFFSIRFVSCFLKPSFWTEPNQILPHPDLLKKIIKFAKIFLFFFWYLRFF